jgi:hypothetical protein
MRVAFPPMNVLFLKYSSATTYDRVHSVILVIKVPRDAYEACRRFDNKF